jgi:hypothetical protein
MMAKCVALLKQKNSNWPDQLHLPSTAFNLLQTYTKNLQHNSTQGSKHHLHSPPPSNPTSIRFKNTHKFHEIEFR